jgi:hypothetical protein
MGYGIRIGVLLGPEGAVIGAIAGATFGILSAVSIIYRNHQTYKEEL